MVGGLQTLHCILQLLRGLLAAGELALTGLQLLCSCQPLCLGMRSLQPGVLQIEHGSLQLSTLSCVLLLQPSVLGIKLLKLLLAKHELAASLCLRGR